MSLEKKRKRDGNKQVKQKEPILVGQNGKKHKEHDLNTAKPSAVFAPRGGREWTVSVALASSAVSNAQSHDAKTHLAGTIARALAVFCVDEVIIFDDSKEGSEEKSLPVDEDIYTAFSHPSHFLCHLLSYLETPPQLRKALFTTHQNLRTAGTLPSLDMPHHLRPSEWCEYREGVTSYSTDDGTYVDVGLSVEYFLPEQQIPANTRVTLKIQDDSTSRRNPQQMTNATAVNPAEPREALGYYWGYTIRQSSSLSAVFTECPFDGGYDLSIGTSERGAPINSIASQQPQASPSKTTTDTKSTPPNLKFNHLLMTFGGPTGLETAATNDPELARMGITKQNVKDLFDHWVNFLPGQGSRTIRTEEAVWLGLMGTRFLVDSRRDM